MSTYQIAQESLDTAMAIVLSNDLALAEARTQAKALSGEYNRTGCSTTKRRMVEVKSRIVSLLLAKQDAEQKLAHVKRSYDLQMCI